MILPPTTTALHLTGLPESIPEYAAALRERRFSCVEATRMVLAAAHESQSTLNAFITITDELALRRAEQVDAALATDGDLGPLTGIPVAVKDVFAIRGVRSTAGSLSFDGRIPTTSAVVVDRLQAAGAVMVGTTNMDQFAFGPHQEDFGRTNCPSDLTRYAGGSSGGTAAAVASGLVLAALGSDAGGSTRFPAACCGVVGLKPTFGAISTDGVFPTFPTVDHVGLVTSDVVSMRDLLGVLADRALPASNPKASGPSLSILAGWAETCDADVAQAVGATLAAWDRAGATLSERWHVTELDESVAVLVSIVGPEAAAALAPHLPVDGRGVPEAIMALLAAGAAEPAVEYLGALERRRRMGEAVDAALAGTDALVMPTSTTTAWKWSDIDGSIMGVHADSTRFLPLTNLTGHPTISIPAASSGLPVGIQLIGRRGGDVELLDIAAWAERHSGVQRGGAG